MRFTTSRRPSPGTRRLARIMASFLGADYMTRGKSGLDDEDEIWMVVVEEHGNPTGLARRSCGEEKILRFTIYVEGESKRLKMDRPAVVGAGKAARDVAEFFDLDFSPEGAAGRVIRVGGDRIDFVDGEDLMLRLNI
jgi:U3 small nucleolar ribonucleoprotein protein IMP4